jgi:hypothetical protein
MSCCLDDFVSDVKNVFEFFRSNSQKTIESVSSDPNLSDVFADLLAKMKGGEWAYRLAHPNDERNDDLKLTFSPQTSTLGSYVARIAQIAAHVQTLRLEQLQVERVLNHVGSPEKLETELLRLMQQGEWNILDKVLDCELGLPYDSVAAFLALGLPPNIDEKMSLQQLGSLFERLSTR